MINKMADNVSAMAPGGVYCPPATCSTPGVQNQRRERNYHTGGRGADRYGNDADATIGGASGYSSGRSASIARSLPKLQKFDGTDNWRSFYVQFRTYERLSGWTTDERLTNLCLCLRGKVLDFFVCQLVSIQGDYIQIVEKL